MIPEMIAMMEEYAVKAKEITIRTEWFTPQELIAHMINRTASYHMAASSPDNVLGLISAYRELQNNYQTLLDDAVEIRKGKNVWI